MRICLHGSNYIRHIKEHMSDYYKEDDMEDQLNLDTDEATQFHYFKLHDYDNNNKLDGLELYSAINHYAQHHGEEGEANQNSLEEEQIVALVDTVMKQDDYNDDGFVDYFEFVKAQKEVKSNADEV